MAALVYVLNERQMCWRTQTPGVAVAGSSTITAWCYSPLREQIAWAQDGSGATSADIFKSVEDSDLQEPIPGADLVTYPQVPDDDDVAMKRFHEVVYTYSLVGAASNNPTLSYSFGASGGTPLQVEAKPILDNPVSPTIETPQFFQARVMVPRTAHVGQSLIARISAPLDQLGAWRLHAIDVTWQPESPRSVNR